MTVGPGIFLLNVDRIENADYPLYGSSDLQSWTLRAFYGAIPGSTTTMIFDVTADVTATGKYFFRVPEVTNPPFIDKAGGQLTVNLGADPPLVIDFNAAYKCDYTQSAVTTTYNYYWFDAGLLVQVYIDFDPGPAVEYQQLYLDFSGGTGFSRHWSDLNTTGTFPLVP